jgi:hypothetical protein
MDAGWEAAGALAIFDNSGNFTTVMSPYNSYSTTQTQVVLAGDRDGHRSAGMGEEAELAYGPRGSIMSYPAGFLSGTVLVAGTGIGRTMRSWYVCFL